MTDLIKTLCVISGVISAMFMTYTASDPVTKAVWAAVVMLWLILWELSDIHDAIKEKS